MAKRTLWKWLQTKGAAWGEAIVFLAVGGLATYMKPIVGIPVFVVLLFIGSYLIYRAYKQEKIQVQEEGRKRRVLKKSGFFREDAQRIYEKWAEHFEKMCTRADQIIINAHSSEVKLPGLLEADLSMRAIFSDMQKAKRRCGDRWLDEYMDNLKQLMLKAASYGISSTEAPSILALDIAHRQIREHINKMKSRYD
jgi:hypothetical protein